LLHDELFGSRDELGCADSVKVEFRSSLADGLVGLRVLRQRDEGSMRTQDARLLAGDLGDGVAEVLLVIECDIGDDRQQGIDDVGGVKAAAQTDLKNRDLSFLLSEVEKGERGEDLKEARVVRKLSFSDQLLRGRVGLEVESGEVIVGDRLTV